MEERVKHLQNISTQVCLCNLSKLIWGQTFCYLSILCRTEDKSNSKLIKLSYKMYFINPLLCDGQCTYPCFPRVLFTSTLYNIYFRPLATFPHNHLQTIAQWREGSEFYCNDYHQTSERILAKAGIEPATSCC